MSDDPLTMYYVVRKDAAMTLGQAMALAGAGAVRCIDELSGDERYAQAFGAWRDRPRKVALRAGADEVDSLRSELSGAFLAETLLCLPPMRKSDRPQLLADLRPFTDPPRPREEPPEPAPEEALVYVVRPGVIRTTGKAMAQAGHAAVMATERLGDALDGWRRAGMPGRVRVEPDPDAWDRLKGDPRAVVVRDAGLTQVEAGTETVIALAPDP